MCSAGAQHELSSYLLAGQRVPAACRWSAATPAAPAQLLALDGCEMQDASDASRQLMRVGKQQCIAALLWLCRAREVVAVQR